MIRLLAWSRSPSEPQLDLRTRRVQRSPDVTDLIPATAAQTRISLVRFKIGHLGELRGGTAQRSDRAQAKASRQQDYNGNPLRSFRGLPITYRLIALAAEDTVGSVAAAGRCSNVVTGPPCRKGGLRISRVSANLLLPG
jgi:hypothetical protein